jgi:site-specific recombinase
MTAAGDTGRHYYTRERGEYRNLVVGPNGDTA